MSAGIQLLRSDSHLSLCLKSKGNYSGVVRPISNKAIASGRTLRTLVKSSSGTSGRSTKWSLPPDSETQSVLIQLSPLSHCSYCIQSADVTKMLSVGVKLASWRRNCWDVRKQKCLNGETADAHYFCYLGLLLEIHSGYTLDFSCGSVLRCETQFHWHQQQTYRWNQCWWCRPHRGTQRFPNQYNFPNRHLIFVVFLLCPALCHFCICNMWGLLWAAAG